MKDAPELLTTQDMADLLGVTAKTWRTYKASGKTPTPLVQLGITKGWGLEAGVKWVAQRKGIDRTSPEYQALEDKARKMAERNLLIQD